MFRRVANVRTDVSEELSASIIRVTRIGELGTMLAVTSNRRTLRRMLVTANIPSSTILVTLMKEALSYSETSVLTRATWRNIPDDAIQQFTSSEITEYF
jgi:predicted aspartyl protease